MLPPKGPNTIITKGLWVFIRTLGFYIGNYEYGPLRTIPSPKGPNTYMARTLGFYKDSGFYIGSY